MVIVFDAENQSATIRIRKGRDEFSDLVSDLAPASRLPIAGLLIPERLEVEMLPLLVLEQVTNLLIAQVAGV